MTDSSEGSAHRRQLLAAVSVLGLSLGIGGVAVAQGQYDTGAQNTHKYGSPAAKQHSMKYDDQAPEQNSHKVQNSSKAHDYDMQQNSYKAQNSQKGATYYSPPDG